MVAAVGSYLEARSRGGRWLLRIEDVDTPRVVAGAAEGILATLVRYGLEWDGEIVWQSRRTDAYRAAFEALYRRAAVFPCACSRKELADSALTRDGARRYPGTCRAGLLPGQSARAWRLRVEPGVLCFDDALQGRVCEDLAEEVGDFVVRRGDGVFAYQLAVVVDDAAAGVTHVVRGADLLDSTCRQLWVQRCLGLPQPGYLHLPVAVNAAGEKLSKQTLARAVDGQPPAAVLYRVLRFLGQQPPVELASMELRAAWDWAIGHWRCDAIPLLAARGGEEDEAAAGEGEA